LEWNVAHGDLIYIKASLGKTGESIEIDGEVRDLLQQVVRRARAIKPDMLLGVGIGLQKPEQIAALARLDVDMAIVGTRLVEHSQQGEAALVEYLEALRRATVRGE
jgi:tryptophan synthase alpha subunit